VGAHIPAGEIDEIYTAGAACVLPGHFNTTHLNALRQFCRNSRYIASDVPSDQPVDGITSALPIPAKRPFENSAHCLYGWMGCISAALWICAFLKPNTSYAVADLVPVPVYAALPLRVFR